MKSLSFLFANSSWRSKLYIFHLWSTAAVASIAIAAFVFGAARSLCAGQMVSLAIVALFLVCRRRPHHDLLLMLNFLQASTIYQGVQLSETLNGILVGLWFLYLAAWFRVSEPIGKKATFLIGLVFLALAWFAVYAGIFRGGMSGWIRDGSIGKINVSDNGIYAYFSPLHVFGCVLHGILVVFAFDFFANRSRYYRKLEKIGREGMLQLASGPLYEERLKDLKDFEKLQNVSFSQEFFFHVLPTSRWNPNPLSPTDNPMRRAIEQFACELATASSLASLTILNRSLVCYLGSLRKKQASAGLSQEERKDIKWAVSASHQLLGLVIKYQNEVQKINE
ncbi:hypothetical protein [Rhodopirellula sp. MGV]|uniref:hypothetical protein n=1 Tax=Rhodopirellula sp. MGV TaxID=2023130 RepID=UPI000B962D99|nr:hypothetical protein [Rhodopirellula sp. MGV]OYP28472.1 hypothetical protein CGZ80_27110 [Rhodopirellula sp. MGV]PNY38650.1 hypothetical protein C2E31_01660 [Rhodopirellula baltica]